MDSRSPVTLWVGSTGSLRDLAPARSYESGQGPWRGTCETGGTRENRLVSLVYVVCSVCLAELDEPDEQNKPDEPVGQIGRAHV